MATVSSDHSAHWPAPQQPAEMRDNADLGLGELLRRARQRRGLTIRDISNETKIPVWHLDALERENLAVVPDAFYRRAEVRAYARAVHLDQNLALARLERALEVHEKPEVPQARGVQLPTPQRQYGLIVVSVLIAAALAGWMWQRESAPVDDPLAIDAIDSPRGRPTADPPPPRSIAARSMTSAPVAASPPVSSVPRAAATSPAGADAATPSNQDTPASQDTPGTSDASRKALVTTTELVVATEPAGARVTVNGIGWGTAPVTIRHLSPGEKLIRVSKEGYISEDRLVHLGENQQGVLDIRLRTRP